MAKKTRSARATFTLVIATTPLYRFQLSARERWRIRQHCVRFINRQLTLTRETSRLSSIEVEMIRIGGEEN